jgi:hypothetical protein
MADDLRGGEQEDLTRAIVTRLRSYRVVHQQWVVHLEHCAGCPDCAANVVDQVGDVDKHRGDAAFYDEVIALITKISSTAETATPETNDRR